MNDKILERLRGIASEHDVQLLFASDSGSRACGFPSEDSDLDVRFVYCHRLDWYLSVQPGRDVIEIDLHGDPVLDIRGWDIRKALRPIGNSNMSPYEWLGSPIAYMRDDVLCDILTSVMPSCFAPSRAAQHYLSMAKSNIKKLDTGVVRLKTYLYATRLLLCCRWVVDEQSAPPVLFRSLVERFLAKTPTEDAINEVIRQKASSREGDHVQRISVLDQFIFGEQERLCEILPSEATRPTGDDLNRAFRSIVEEAERLSSHSLGRAVRSRLFNLRTVSGEGPP